MCVLVRKQNVFNTHVCVYFRLVGADGSSGNTQAIDGPSQLCAAPGAHARCIQPGWCRDAFRVHPASRVHHSSATRQQVWAATTTLEPVCSISQSDRRTSASGHEVKSHKFLLIPTLQSLHVWGASSSHVCVLQGLKFHVLYWARKLRSITLSVYTQSHATGLPIDASAWLCHRCDVRKEAVVDAGAIPALLRTFAMGIPELQAHLKAGPVAFTPDIAAPSAGVTGDLMDAATAAESASLDPCRYLQVCATCPPAAQNEGLLTFSSDVLANHRQCSSPVARHFGNTVLAFIPHFCIALHRVQ